MAGLNSRDGVCSVHVSAVSDEVPCVRHFRVRGDGDSIVESFRVQNVLIPPSHGHPAAGLEGTPLLISPTSVLH